LDFSFEIHSESEEVYMERAIHIFESFKTIIYFKFLELRKGIFGVVKV
jgi:hypothetical protein